MKKKLLILLLFSLTFTWYQTSLPSITAASILGDLNNDNTVDSLDMALVKNHLLGSSTLKSPSLADVNKDGVTDVIDYSLYKKYLLKEINVFPGLPTITATPSPIKIPISGGTMNTSAIKTKYINVKYEKISNSQTLDIYIPNDIPGPYPVILAVHGGAFYAGNAKGADIAPMLEGGINHGYAVVSVDYRLSNEAKFPAAVNDVKAAVRFIKANASKYNFDSSKIAAWGSSAGGYFISMLGTSANVTTLNNDNKENLSYHSNVQAVIDWFGPIDFSKMDLQFASSGVASLLGSHSGENSPESSFLGQAVSSNLALAQKANPETYISSMDISSSPFFFIQHGSNDNLVPYQQSTNLGTLLKEKLGKDKVTVEIIKGAGHGTQEFSSSANINKVFIFLDSVFQ